MEEEPEVFGPGRRGPPKRNSLATSEMWVVGTLCVPDERSVVLFFDYLLREVWIMGKITWRFVKIKSQLEVQIQCYSNGRCLVFILFELYSFEKC